MACKPTIWCPRVDSLVAVIFFGGSMVSLLQHGVDLDLVMVRGSMAGNIGCQIRDDSIVFSVKSVTRRRKK